LKYNFVAITLLLMVLTLSAAEDVALATPEEFKTCISSLEDKALAEGISRSVVESQLAKVKFDPRIIGYDRAQPEFTQTFSGYYYQRVTESRIQRGQKLYSQFLPLLTEITRQTGVPGRYIVAFWGMETNFGSYFGKLPVLDSLATLACDHRRSAFFTGELISALKILDRGDISSDQLKGSWAGALGHVQFLPSVYLRYAHDADNDGRRDLWNSIPDALTSAGFFLKGLGWNAQERWGREVILPEGFDYSLANLKSHQPLAYWRDKDVRTVFGGVLPDLKKGTSLLVPAGHRGPAFLVYPNFNVIMAWNQSEFYALSIGILADKIIGAGPLRQPPPKDLQRLTRKTVMFLQEKLQLAEYDPGPLDGIMGPSTRRAISGFQKSKGWIADGFPHPEVLAAFMLPVE
jgi:membrane-bound lytic murein transglycosylase B